MPSLRRRLLVGTVFGAAVILLAAGISLYAMMRASLLSEFDNALREKAATLAAMIEYNGDRIDLEFTEADIAEFVRDDRPEYFQVWHADGTVVERSPSLNRQDLLRIDDGVRGSAMRAIELPDGRPGRVAVLPVTARLDDEADPSSRPQRLVFALARDVLDVNATLTQLLLVLFVVGVLAVAATVGVLALLIRVGLRPADRLANEISGIDERRLAMRINPAIRPRHFYFYLARSPVCGGRGALEACVC